MKRIRKKFRKGSATMILGVFILLAFFAFIMMFMEMYNIRENYLVTKTATDTIADGTALYAMKNYDANMSDIQAKADEIASVVESETNSEIGSFSISEDSYTDDYTISVSVNTSFPYVSTFNGGGTYSVRTNSATEFMTLEAIKYGVAPEALSDATFRRMLEVAEEQMHAGCYYVSPTHPGGGNRYAPGTSFDCSGFVSYVINEATQWNVGQADTTGLLSFTTAVSPEEAKPGDLIFFQGTYRNGVSHVGIYCGGTMMIHISSGHNQIMYQDFNTPYYQQHFLCFGRLPGL